MTSSAGPARLVRCAVPSLVPPAAPLTHLSAVKMGQVMGKHLTPYGSEIRLQLSREEPGKVIMVATR